MHGASDLHDRQAKETAGNPRESGEVRVGTVAHDPPIDTVPDVESDAWLVPDSDAESSVPPVNVLESDPFAGESTSVAYFARRAAEIGAESLRKSRVPPPPRTRHTSVAAQEGSAPAVTHPGAELPQPSAADELFALEVETGVMHAVEMIDDELEVAEHELALADDVSGHSEGSELSALEADGSAASQLVAADAEAVLEVSSATQHVAGDVSSGDVAGVERPSDATPLPVESAMTRLLQLSAAPSIPLATGALTAEEDSRRDVATSDASLLQVPDSVTVEVLVADEPGARTPEESGLSRDVEALAPGEPCASTARELRALSDSHAQTAEPPASRPQEASSLSRGGEAQVAAPQRASAPEALRSLGDVEAQVTAEQGASAPEALKSQGDAEAQAAAEGSSATEALSLPRGGEARELPAQVEAPSAAEQAARATNESRSLGDVAAHDVREREASRVVEAQVANEPGTRALEGSSSSLGLEVQGAAEPHASAPDAVEAHVANAQEASSATHDVDAQTGADSRESQGVEATPAAEHTARALAQALEGQVDASRAGAPESGLSQLADDAEPAHAADAGAEDKSSDVALPQITFGLQPLDTVAARDSSAGTQADVAEALPLGAATEDASPTAPLASAEHAELPSAPNQPADSHAPAPDGGLPDLDSSAVSATDSVPSSQPVAAADSQPLAAKAPAARAKRPGAISAEMRQSLQSLTSMPSFGRPAMVPPSPAATRPSGRPAARAQTGADSHGAPAVRHTTGSQPSAATEARPVPPAAAGSAADALSKPDSPSEPPARASAASWPQASMRRTGTLPLPAAVAPAPAPRTSSDGLRKTGAQPGLSASEASAALRASSADVLRRTARAGVPDVAVAAAALATGRHAGIREAQVQPASTLTGHPAPLPSEVLAGSAPQESQEAEQSPTRAARPRSSRVPQPRAAHSAESTMEHSVQILQRQLVHAIERARQSEERSVDAQRRAEAAEQLAQDARRISMQVQVKRREAWYGYLARSVIVALVLGLMCFSLGGYLSLLFPVRERVLTQEAALRSLTSTRDRLEQEKHQLVEQLQRKSAAEQLGPSGGNQLASPSADPMITPP